MKNLGSWKCVFLVLFVFGMCMSLAPPSQAAMVMTNAVAENIQIAATDIPAAPNILIANEANTTKKILTEANRTKQSEPACANCHPNSGVETRTAAQFFGQQSAFNVANLTTQSVLAISGPQVSNDFYTTQMRANLALTGQKAQWPKAPMSVSSNKMVAANSILVTTSAAPASSNS